MAARVASTIAALTLLVAAAGCSEHTPRTPGPDDGAKLDFAPKATLAIDDGGLQPSTVKTGPAPVAITVVNRGTRPDGITSGPIDGDSSQGIDTGSLRPGESTTVFITSPSTIAIHSRADPAHTGTIDVEGIR